MEQPKRFQVTVSFACGARATVMMSNEPVIPPSLWADGSLSWLGDTDGPMLEIAGDDVLSLSVHRLDGTTARRRSSRTSDLAARGGPRPRA